MRLLFDEKLSDQGSQIFSTSDATDCQPLAWSKQSQAPSDKLRIPLIMASVKNHFERHLEVVQA
jgi:hypothetical protein